MSSILKFAAVMAVLLLVSAALVYAQAPPPAPGAQNPPPPAPAAPPPPNRPSMPMPGPMYMGGMMGQSPIMVVEGKYIFILRGDQLLQYEMFQNDVLRLRLVDQTTLPQPPPRMAPPPPGAPLPSTGAPMPPQSLAPKSSGAEGESVAMKQETPKS